MPLEKKTAILIIHGVGSHTPFEVLDSFVRGFHEEFKNKNRQIKTRHKLKKRENWGVKGIGGVQHYISLSVPRNKGCIDFYEYFWDIYMIHDINFSEVFKLLIKASKSARQFYEQLPKEKRRLLSKATDIGEYGRKRKFGTGPVEFRPAGYLKLLGPIFVGLSIFLPYLPLLIKVINWWASTQLPVINQLFKAVSVLVDKAVKEFAGDLVRYLDLDPRSEHYETRQIIINGALDELRALTKGNRYNQIIIAGHSLGSVIAYDALNRLIQDTNAKRMSEKEAEKIIGLVTFGSPLDKIALFFREHVKEGKEIQRQILANMHGFKTREYSLVEGEPEIDIGTPMNFNLPETRWLNFYHTRDLVSGRLDLYNLEKQRLHHPGSEDGNILIDENDDKKKKISRMAAHSYYWGAHLGEGKGTNKMYEVILEEFFP